MVITPITVANLTTKVIGGDGVFDVLMAANKAHLEQEFTKGRIAGPEYAQVYLGSLESVMQTALQFLLQKDKMSLEAELAQQQILLTQAEIRKTDAIILQTEGQTRLLEQQILNTQVEKQILEANLLKLPVELAILQANLLKIPVEKQLLEAQLPKISAEVGLINKQVELASQQKLNLIAEGLNLPKQGVLLDKQVLDIVQKTLNATIEYKVMEATECKLKAEFDLLVLTKLKVNQETALVEWKVTTEKAQTVNIADVNSVVGVQKSLFTAQTAGFARDAEQKATKIMVDTWNTRRMTDDATVNNSENKLDDATIGRMVNKLLNGIGA